MTKTMDEIPHLMKFAEAFAKKKIGALPYLGISEKDLAQSAFAHYFRHWTPDICKPEAPRDADQARPRRDLEAK